MVRFDDVDVVLDFGDTILNGELWWKRRVAGIDAKYFAINENLSKWSSSWLVVTVVDDDDDDDGNEIVDCVVVVVDLLLL